MNYLSLIDTLGSILNIPPAVIDGAHKLDDRRMVSLPQFVKPSLIESPNFMQASLAEEPVVNDVIKNLYNLYIGYILCALQMNDMVVGNRRVRDLLETVSSTESFINSQMLVQGLSGAVEAFDPKSIQQAPGESDADYKRRLWEAQQRHDLDKSMLPSVTGSNHVPDRSISVPIASGRQVEVTFAAGPDREPIKVLINVKFNTRLIPNEVVEHIVSHDVTTSIFQRWLQFRAGEIRFFKDFIFKVDQMQRKAQAMKSDKTNVLYDMFTHKNESMFRRMLHIAGKNKSYNLANSILMLDEETATYYARKSNFSFDKLADRKRFFDNTYNLFIVLIDNRFSRVTIYTNGIDQAASYSFNEMKASGSSDKMSLKDIMEYLSKSQMPKF